MSRMSAHAAAAAQPWYRTITAEQWRVLAAAKLGWMLDALDFMLYTMALNQLRVYFSFGDATAGFLGTGSAISAYIFPRSVAGSKAPQSAAFQSPAVVFFADFIPAPPK